MGRLPSVSEELPELLQRAVGGDSAAADEFVRRYGAPVRAVIHLRVGPELRQRVDTDDLFQSTMNVALNSLQGLSYRGENALVGWLRAIAERRVKMAVRHHRAERRDVRRGVRLETGKSLPGAVTGPPDRAARQEEAERIREAVRGLKPMDREAIELRSFEGLTFREMADRLGLSGVHAARQRFERALKRLGRELDT